ncbi:MAG: lipoprotein insertase outer membrane protein LolB [Gammaproteobacteria bacterium]|nr:lipoprotein insertase outer membrane protein LolB [Gammaproteobacteria bacterium]
MNRHFSFLTVSAIVCLLLSSCAMVKDDSVRLDRSKIKPAGWSAEIQKRQQITAWELRGRLGVQTRDTGGSMDIIWQQADDDFTIRLLAPMGAGNYLIQGEKGVAEIRYPDGEKEFVDNVDEVFKSALEVDLPVSAVKDWIRGLPAGELPVESIEWNTNGLIDRISQSGWNVEMKKYSGQKILIPFNIYLSRDDEPELGIRLVLRQWLVDN